MSWLKETIIPANETNWTWADQSAVKTSTVQENDRINWILKQFWRSPKAENSTSGTQQSKTALRLFSGTGHLMLNVNCALFSWATFFFTDLHQQFNPDLEINKINDRLKANTIMRIRLNYMLNFRVFAVETHSKSKQYIKPTLLLYTKGTLLLTFIKLLWLQPSWKLPS